jgi:hypothetical protein
VMLLRSSRNGMALFTELVKIISTRCFARESLTLPQAGYVKAS